MSNLQLTVELDKASLARVMKWLLMFPLEVQDRITKNALRYYAKDVMYMASGLTPRRQGFSRLGWAYRIKAWPSGMVWVGIGERIKPGKSQAGDLRGRKRRQFYDSEGVGWRTHFTELGHHSWPIGKNHGGHGRGWKLAKYHRGQGQKKPGTKASIIAMQAMSRKVIPYLLQELHIATQRMHGLRVNRKSAGRIAKLIEGKI